MRILNLTKVGDRGKKQTKVTNIFFEILVLLINERVFRIQRSDKTIFEKLNWWLLVRR